MPLITCEECGNQVSGTAESCPQCGAKGAALHGTKKMGWLAKGCLIFFGGSLAAGLVANAIFPTEPKSVAARQEDDIAARRNFNIANYAKSLKAAARDPGSVSFDRISSNDDGTLVCFQYRAENRARTIRRRTVAFSPAGGSQDATVVRTICQDKDMRDVTKAAKYVIAGMH